MLWKQLLQKNATVQIEAGRQVNREIDYYNLDAILSVGYRVNSKRGTQFRIWANKILKNYLLKGYAVNKRMDRLENKVEVLSEKVEQIDLEIHTSLPPKQGIFFDGQIFDAYRFACDIIKQAKSSIKLIDNYVDESVLILLTKRSKGVEAVIYTRENRQLLLDLEKHNSQYSNITIKKLNKSHDRFIIIDKNIIYHIGASLKDLGKKWFAFTRLDLDASVILSRLS